MRRRSTIAGGAALGLVAVGAGAFAVAQLHSRSTHEAGLTRSGSVVIDRRPDTSIPADPPPSTYHAVYRTSDRGPGHDVTGTEVDWVRRPFEGRRETRSGASAQPAQTTVWAFGRFEVRNAGASTSQALQTPPAAAGNDLRPDAVRADAIEATYFLPRERRRVGGVTCQVYRTMQGARPGPFEPTERNADRYSDLCFDRRGLLVEEAGFDHGTLVHRKVLTTIETDVPIDDARFAITGTDLTLQQGGGSVRALDPSSRPPGDSFFELDGPPPEGFTLRGRYAVVPPQPEAFSNPLKYDSRQAGVVDVYVKGVDFLLVDRGGTLGGADPFVPEPAADKVDLGPIGQGEALLGLTGTQVRATVGGGHYVRVTGTAPEADLVALTRRLTPQPGGELRFLDASS